MCIHIDTAWHMKINNSNVKWVTSPKGRNLLNFRLEIKAEFKIETNLNHQFHKSSLVVLKVAFSVAKLEISCKLSLLGLILELKYRTD